MKVCRDFMHNRCTHQNCKFLHDKDICFHFWKHGSCKFGEKCHKKHISDNNKKHIYDKKKIKNTETFEPMTKPIDMRLVFDNGKDRCTTFISSRDVVMAPNLFNDYLPGELYKKLVSEIDTCGVPQDKLLKLWHGDTHLIADDHTSWKASAPTFNMILDRIRTFFKMNIQATRFNLYKDTSQWKPFHFDSSAVNPEKAKIQNFTVAVSFGATRDAAFEDAKTKTVISIPQPDGCTYCFAKDTNILWRHGILKEKEIRNEGRISVIAWGWIDNQFDLT